MTATNVRSWQGPAHEALREENRLKAKRYRLVAPVPEKELQPGQYMKRPCSGDQGSPQGAGAWILTWCPLPGDGN